jgi:hypothetical protein
MSLLWSCFNVTLFRPLGTMQHRDSGCRDLKLPWCWVRALVSSHSSSQLPMGPGRHDTWWAGAAPKHKASSIAVSWPGQRRSRRQPPHKQGCRKSRLMTRVGTAAQLHSDTIAKRCLSLLVVQDWRFCFVGAASANVGASVKGQNGEGSIAVLQRPR